MFFLFIRIKYWKWIPQEKYLTIVKIVWFIYILGLSSYKSNFNFHSRVAFFGNWHCIIFWKTHCYSVKTPEASGTRVGSLKFTHQFCQVAITTKKTIKFPLTFNLSDNTQMKITERVTTLLARWPGIRCYSWRSNSICLLSCRCYSMQHAHCTDMRRNG